MLRRALAQRGGRAARSGIRGVRRHLPHGRRYTARVRAPGRLLTRWPRSGIRRGGRDFVGSAGLADEGHAGLPAVLRFSGDHMGLAEGVVLLPGSAILGRGGHSRGRDFSGDPWCLSVLNQICVDRLAASRYGHRRRVRPLIEMGTHGDPRAGRRGKRPRPRTGRSPPTSNCGAGAVRDPHSGHQRRTVHAGPRRRGEKEASPREVSRVGRRDPRCWSNYDVGRRGTQAVEVAGPDLGAVRGFDHGDTCVVASQVRFAAGRARRQADQDRCYRGTGRAVIAAAEPPPGGRLGVGTSLVTGSGRAHRALVVTAGAIAGPGGPGVAACSRSPSVGRHAGRGGRRKWATPGDQGESTAVTEA
jgi:nicotinate phosphoribosyltransferase